jgi:hypothetical protein
VTWSSKTWGVGMTPTATKVSTAYEAAGLSPSPNGATISTHEGIIATGGTPVGHLAQPGSWEAYITGHRDGMDWEVQKSLSRAAARAAVVLLLPNGCTGADADGAEVARIVDGRIYLS